MFIADSLPKLDRSNIFAFCAFVHIAAELAAVTCDLALGLGGGWEHTLHECKLVASSSKLSFWPVVRLCPILQGNVLESLALELSLFLAGRLLR